MERRRFIETIGFSAAAVAAGSFIACGNILKIQKVQDTTKARCLIQPDSYII